MNFIILNSDTDIYLKKGQNNICSNLRLISRAVFTGMVVYAV